MRPRRRGYVPPDLTSLFDVLFIVIFAALIRAASVEQAAAAKQPEPPKPVQPQTPSALRTAALTQLGDRPLLVIHVTPAGVVTSLEADGKVTPLDVPLLEHSTDPDVALSYLGDRSAELRVCRIAALHLGAADLAKYLVVIAPAARLADLPHALFTGLHADLDRCLAEQHGVAALVDPSELPATGLPK